jgi:hypothetical protein
LYFIAINAQKRLTKYSPRERKQWVILAYNSEADFSIKMCIPMCCCTPAGSGVVPDTRFFHLRRQRPGVRIALGPPVD